MRIKNINKTYFAIILFAAALLLLSIPIARVSQNNPAIFGSTHYDHINEKTILLDFLLGFIPQIALSVSFPLILAIFSLIFFAKLLSRHVKDEHQLYYALIILVLTPTFIGLHSGLHNYQFILFFGLLFALLYDIGSRWYYVPLALLYVVDPLVALFLTLGLIVITNLKDKKQESLILSFFLVGMILVSHFLLASTFSFSTLSFSFNQLFSFFNASFGYSLFLLVLGFGGIFFEKKRALPLIVFSLSLFYEPLRVLALPLLAYYAAISFHKLEKREWTINFIGNLTLVLFICILLFGSSTFIKESIQEQPHAAHVDALLFLEDNGAQAKVLSSSKLSSFITFMTGQQVMSSPNYFYSQNYNFIVDQFKKNNIGYILIDKSMKQGTIWQHDEEGLLFLLKYNDNFRKIYENKEVEIYYFPPWRE